jgi:geranylgeranyl pyrophosphate synthase
MASTTATFFDLVRSQLPAVEMRMRAGAGNHHPNLDEAIEHLLSSGGKRIRPTLTLLTGGMLGADPARAVTLAAAIEMLHTATLVHDDLIDGSVLRRGLPTLNSRWGAGATVLAGDYVFARAAQLAAQTGSLPLMEIFARTLMTIVNGEITQLFHARQGDTREDYFNRIYAKTASLFELSTEAAALLGDSPPGTVAAMKDYGYHIGIAFQIVDDLLDFVGDEEQVGKPLATDLRQGIVTLPTLYYMQARHDDPDLALVFEGRATEESLRRLVDAIRRSGAVERSIEEARDFASIGEANLAGMPEGSERTALYELARYVVERST